MKKITAIVFDHDGTLVDTTVAPRQLFPGIKALLTELKRRGIKLYVWTARGRASTVEILETLDIIGQFDLLSCGGEAAAKPSAAGISDILPHIDPAEVVVIGDSLGDMFGGRAFGAHCIGAMWGHGSARAKEVMKESGAIACFLSVKECEEYLLKIIEDKNV